MKLPLDRTKWSIFESEAAMMVYLTKPEETKKEIELPNEEATLPQIETFNF